MAQQRSKSVARAVKREASRELPTEKKPQVTADSYVNLMTQTGMFGQSGGQNLNDFGTYGFNPITRMRIILDFAYRSSWVCRAIVQSIAEDMTREGIQIGSELPPDQAEIIYTALDNEFFIWDKFRETIQWSRLYGGAGAYIMVDGQKPETPLKLDAVTKNQFNGLLPLDRWMLTPSYNDLVVDQKHPDYGKPRFYRTTGDTPLPSSTNIHHTRFLRFEGDDLPWYQKLGESLWGMSVLEPVWDRLLSFDQTTASTAQLVNRASLRQLYIEGWKEIQGGGGEMLAKQLAAIDMMRFYQRNEGITILDSKDKFEAFQYQFGGLDSVLIQMGQQLSGASGIPMVRLFGQSPVGFNATGESDLRNYYDMVKSRQHRGFRSKIETVLRIVAKSKGIKLPEGFGFSFNPLWQMRDQDKVEYAAGIGNQAGALFSEGIVTKAMVLQELKQQSHKTGIWTNISDEDIDAAKEEPPLPGMEGLGGPPGEQGEEPPEPQFLPGSQGPGPAEEPPPGLDEFIPRGKQRSFLPGKPRLVENDTDQPVFEGRPRPKQPIIHLRLDDQNLPGRETEFSGHRVIVEVEKGQVRTAGSSGGATMLAHYGYFPGTVANDGDALDVFLGENPQSNIVYVIDQQNPDTKEFHQPKVFMGFGNSRDVLDVFNGFYADGRGAERFMKGREYTKIDFDKWLEDFKVKSVA